MRLLVALTQALPDDQRAPWVVRIQEQIERIGHQHGSWWQQQATRIPSSVAIEGHRETAAKQLKSILQSAQTSLETGDYQAAADGFETAAAIAEAQQLKDLRRSCVISGSQALEKLGHHDAAAKRQLTIANAQPNHRASASVHLRGCWNLGQADEPDDNQLTTALEQHLQTWPDSPTRATAEQWLANQQLKSGLREAAALTASNRHNQAVAILRTLATQHPEDSKVLLQLARSETQLALSPVGGSDESINRSLKRWRGIAKRLKPESDPWFEAKLSIAKLLHASESPQPARQLLDYLKALPGGWRESAFASEFDSLDRKIAP